MKQGILAGAAAAALVGACAPMEQAPLVYSSSQQFGVQVTAGAPEAPGFNVNIGYKGLDAAFVPVAVAKYCGAKPSAECKEAIYALKPIMGENQRGGTSSVNQQMLERIEGRIQQARADIANEEAEVASAELRKKANAADRARVAALTAEKTSLEAIPADQEGASGRTTRIGEITADLKKISELPTDASIDQTIQNRKSRIEALRAALKEDESLADRMRTSRSAQSTDTKGDAYSVYGSFNGGAAGDRNGATLTLGKVFSTGVAAQNLTQGLQKASAVAAQTECLNKLAETAKKITDQNLQNQFLVDSRGMCASRDLIDYQ